MKEMKSINFERKSAIWTSYLSENHVLYFKIELEPTHFHWLISCYILCTSALRL
jgi:hypothetical protein